MILKIVLGIVIALGLFLGYVATRDGKFIYERSGVISAPAEKIFPYLSQFKLGGQWSPYEKDIEMPKTYGGTEGAVGSWMQFGPSKSGSGRLEILEIAKNEMVKLRLHMTAPFEVDNVVIYRLVPESKGTRFTWTMEGDGGFMGKLMTTLIDCEKMVGGQFTEGINNLKTLVELQGVTLNLTEKPELVSIPEQHYIYVEKKGPFQETAKAAWDEVHRIFKTLPSDVKKIGAITLFKIKPQMVYRAGFVFNTKPMKIPEGAQYIKFEGGQYAKYVLTGSYENLGPAWGRTMEMAQKSNLANRDDFYIESYINDPSTTPEAQLISELMIPTKY